MADNTLFPEPSKERQVALRRGEPQVHWYSQCSLPEAVEGRRILNEWYREVKGPMGQFATRLRSENDVDHEQSIDELYVHHLLAQVVEDVRYEEDGGPDFRLYNDGRVIGSVEVASLFECQEWKADRTQHDILAMEINQLLPPSAGWYVDLDLDPGQPAPSRRRLVAFLQDELKSLPPPGPEARKLISHFGIARTAIYRPRPDGPAIRIAFSPMKPGAAAMSDPDASLVRGPIIGGRVTAGERLRKVLKKKVDKSYDLRGAPFLVVVGLHDRSCSSSQVISGLYGGEQIFAAVGSSAPPPIRWFFDGFNTRVSAVATLETIRPWQEQPSTLFVWDNPAAQSSWPDHILPVDQRLGFGADGVACWR